ncbi:MAG: hypothetical protein IKJ13_03150 [Clostridia bacterium]|nr:hypothetical protein [Clostridia bacterium]
MRIKTILKIAGEIRFVKSVLCRYGDSLARGRYYQHNSFRALSLDEGETREKARLYFDKNDSGKRMAAIAKKLSSIGYYKNKNKRSTEEYEAFYIANNYDKKREIKLFSFKNNRILTICTSAEEANKQILQYERFSGAYNMPRVKKIEKYNDAFEISMIDLRNFEGEASAFENICNSTVDNNPNVSVLDIVLAKELIEFSYDGEIDYYMRKIVDKISPSLMDIRISLCVQHGDLSKENLIYGECEGKLDFWWIDWEHVGERVFFYDYFFYIINSSLYYNMNAFKSYIAGESDDVLKKMFAHFALEFNSEKRFDYFLLFTISFLKERVCSKGGLPVLKTYYELIEVMEVMLKENDIQ